MALTLNERRGEEVKRLESGCGVRSCMYMCTSCWRLASAKSNAICDGRCQYSPFLRRRSVLASLERRWGCCKKLLVWGMREWGWGFEGVGIEGRGGERLGSVFIDL